MIIETIKKINQKELPSPPNWVKSCTNYFRLGFGLFLMLSLSLGCLLGGCSSNAQGGLPWEEAETYFSQPQLEALVSSSVNGEKVIKKIAKNAQGFEVNKEPQAVLVDFNGEELEGSLGRLYRIILFDKEEDSLTPIFSRYLDSRLPPQEKLLEVLEKQENGLPCLQINQLEDVNIRRSEACFDGLEYKIATSKLFIINKGEE